MPKVAYVHSARLQQLSDVGTHPQGRSSAVHELIHHCGLLGEGRAVIVEPEIASREALLKYHSRGFVDALLSGCSDTGQGTDSSSSESEATSRQRKRRKLSHLVLEEYGISEDCPPFAQLPHYSLAVAGSSLTAAKLLIGDAELDGDDTAANSVDRSSTCSSKLQEDCRSFDVAINLHGGRHHAQRDKASGFCYVQDVVLAIGLLRKEGVSRPLSDADRSQTRRKPRIMYLDLDVHYGDGVASAFVHPYKYSHPPTSRQASQPQPSVLTLSLHHFSPGFFPPDPMAQLSSLDTPTPFTLSIPLKHGAANPTYARLWMSCVEPTVRAFDPDYLVVLLGMDALAGDELASGAGNWSLGGDGGVAWCTEKLKSWQAEIEGRKLMVLGGGGYNVANAARGWACATSVLVDRPLDLDGDVPDHGSWDLYAPSFCLDLPPTNATDRNEDGYLREIEKTFLVLTQRVARIMADEL